MAKLPLSVVKHSAFFSSASRTLLCSPCISNNVAAGQRVAWRALATTPRGWSTRRPAPESIALLAQPNLNSYRSSRQFAFKNDHVNAKPERHSTEQPAGPDSSRPLRDETDISRQRTKGITEKARSSTTSLTPHENIYNIPNILTASRLIATPVIGYLVLHEQHKYALALFAYAGITDLLDGWIARRWKLQTVVGSVVDPMADKVLMTVLTVTLATKGLLPVYLAILILGRDVALATAAIYYRYASLPAPKTFQRYWDFSLPSAEVHPTTMSKFNTFLQLILIGSTLAYPVITADSHHLGIMYDLGLENVSLENGMTYFQWIVAGTTAWSGLSYAYLKNAVTILGTNEQLKLKQGRRGRAIIGVMFGSVVATAIWFALTKEVEKTPLAEDSVAR